MNVEGAVAGVALGNTLVTGFNDLDALIKNKADMVVRIAEVFIEVDAQLASLV